MTELITAIEWTCRWHAKRQSWQRWYGFTVGRGGGSTVTNVLADTEANRRMFVRGII